MDKTPEDIADEERVLHDVDRYGEVADRDLPILHRLRDEGRVALDMYEDYVGYKRVKGDQNEAPRT
jgi:hypothetical protein